MIKIEILNQLNLTRGYTIGRLSQSIDNEWDTQPKGYNNTIRWNAGHIFVTMEYFTNLVIADYETVNPEWSSLFTKGTSPAKWENDVPANAEILSALEEQPARIIKAFEGQLDEVIREPIKIGTHKIETVEAIVQFVVWHEGIHAGIIDGLNRTTSI